MKKVLIATFVIAAISLSACQETVAEYDNTLPRIEPNTTVAFPLTGDSVNANVITTNQADIPAQSNAVKTTSVLNPEHGQPGHRCDIAVGAPLNSPVRAVPQTAPVPQVSLPASQPIMPAGSVTLNPPHGQPGHDCAIPVGQPLKS